MKRNRLLILLVVLFIAIFSAYQFYNKPHEDMRHAKADYRLSAAELYQAYMENERMADEKYLGKKLQITGEISEVENQNGQVLGLRFQTNDVLESIYAQLDAIDTDHRDDFKKGDIVTLNCICTGKLMDIELNRCVEINK